MLDKISPYIPLVEPKFGTLAMELHLNKEVTKEENQGPWILVKRRHRKAPQFRSLGLYDEKMRPRKQPRNNRRRIFKVKSRVSTKLMKVKIASRAPSVIPTLDDYFSKGFFDKKYFTFNVNNVEEKNEVNNESRLFDVVLSHDYFTSSFIALLSRDLTSFLLIQV